MRGQEGARGRTQASLGVGPCPSASVAHLLPPSPSLIDPIRCTTIKRRYFTNQKSKRSSVGSEDADTEEED